MARVTGSSFLISGKVGDKVFRVRDGKMYVSALPKKIKIPDDEGSIMRRDRFAFTMRLVSALYKNNALVSFWRKVYKRDKVITRRMFKVIYACAELLPQITPKGSFNFELRAADTSTEIFEVTVSIPHKIDTFYEPFLLGCMTLSFTDPELKGKEKYNFLSLPSEYVPVTFNEEIKLQFHMTAIQLNEFNSYPLKKIYLTLLTIGRSGGTVQSSSTLEVFN